MSDRYPPNERENPFTKGIMFYDLRYRFSFIWSAFVAVFCRRVPGLRRLTPHILHPDFCWPHFILGDRPLAKEIPPCGWLPSRAVRIMIGWVHHFLCCFSMFYCAWFGYNWTPGMAALPFGLLLKQTGGTNLNEAQAMRAMRDAGFPGAKVISIGEHPKEDYAPVSILMLRLPGRQIHPNYDKIDPVGQKNIERELKIMMDLKHSWKSPWGDRICSITGGPMRSVRVPLNYIDVCQSERDFHNFLLEPATWYKHDPDYLETNMAAALKIHDTTHKIVFSHGDFAYHNILFHDGHISGFIDWEASGWYPEYWDFTSIMRYPNIDPEKGALTRRIGGHRYEAELVAEYAIKALTFPSYDGW